MEFNLARVYQSFQFLLHYWYFSIYRERERETDRDKGWKRDRRGDSERARLRERAKERQADRQTDRGWTRDRRGDSESEREGERQTDMQADRQRQGVQQRGAGREREREKERGFSGVCDVKGRSLRERCG